MYMYPVSQTPLNSQYFEDQLRNLVQDSLEKLSQIACNSFNEQDHPIVKSVILETMEPGLSSFHFGNRLYENLKKVSQNAANDYSASAQQTIHGLRLQTTSLKNRTCLYNELARIKQLHKEFVISHLSDLIKELRKRLEK